MGDVIKRYKLGVILVIALGIALRVYAYWANPSMWHDECAIALNVKFKTYFELFGILDFLQVVPPFFTMLTKLLTYFFGYSERVFRFLPFIAGCLSIPAFYFLAEKTLKSKAAVLVSLLLFSVNNILINYSIEFKPYSLDVLFTILCLLFFINLDVTKLSIKKLVLYGFIISIIPWFSFAPMFVIGACFLNLFLKNYKQDWLKKVALMLPVLISIVLYLVLYMYLNYTKSDMVSSWETHNAFASLDLRHNFALIIKGIKNLFLPMNYTLFFLILFVWGLVTYFRENKEIFLQFFVIWLLPFVTSFFKFYPYSPRLIIFLVPIYILCIVKPLDLISVKNKLKSGLIFFLIISSMFAQSQNIYKYSHKSHIKKADNSREFLDYVVKHLHENDTIYVNMSSNVQFLFYRMFYKIPNVVFVDDAENRSMEEAINELRKIKRGYFWLYLPLNITTVPEFEKIKKMKNIKFLYDYKEGRGRLIYLKMD